jgi:hypothetical protein
MTEMQIGSARIDSQLHPQRLTLGKLSPQFISADYGDSLSRERLQSLTRLHDQQ